MRGITAPLHFRTTNRNITAEIAHLLVRAPACAHVY